MDRTGRSIRLREQLRFDLGEIIQVNKNDWNGVLDMGPDLHQEFWVRSGVVERLHVTGRALCQERKREVDCDRNKNH